jgi:hypothetical protein
MQPERTRMDSLFFGPRRPDHRRRWGGLAHPAGRRSISRLGAYGEGEAERPLADIVDEWRRHRRPGVARLSVGISYGRSRREAWRIRRRGPSTISFDYR